MGCNDGYWTRFLSGRFGTVHAIDPQQPCCDHVRSLALANVVVHRVACWSNIGRLMFHTQRNRYGEHQGAILGADEFVAGVDEVDRYEVPCCPLDTIVGGPVDFIKVDVDGSEVHTLAGAQRIIRETHPTLLVETHNDESRAWLMAWLPKYGYSPRILTEIVVHDTSRWSDVVSYLYAEGGNV